MKLSLVQDTLELGMELAEAEKKEICVEEAGADMGKRKLQLLEAEPEPPEYVFYTT